MQPESQFEDYAPIFFFFADKVFGRGRRESVRCALPFAMTQQSRTRVELENRRKARALGSRDKIFAVSTVAKRWQSKNV